MALLRKLRRHVFADSRFGRYLAYAAGELVLVVAGILIALQINTLNTARENRAKERAFLTQIRSDMTTNIAEMERFLAERTGRVAAARRILTHFNGKPLTDPAAFNQDGISIFSWQRYYLDDNTYRELVSSGNFALLANSRVKRDLLEIEALYGKMKSEEDHYRFDTETALYKPIYDVMDTEALTADADFQLSGGKSGRRAVTAETFTPMLRNNTIKNGFMMTILEYGTMNVQMEELQRRRRSLIAVIDADLARE